MEENTKDSGELQIYEVGYHLLPTVGDENVEKEASKVKEVFIKNGATLISEEMPQIMPLAYDISKKIDTKNVSFSKAYFGWAKFEVNREKADLINKAVMALPNVLRFIVVKTVKENTMFTPKNPMIKKDSTKEEKTEKEEVSYEKSEISEADIDKSIDELVGPETL